MSTNTEKINVRVLYVEDEANIRDTMSKLISRDVSSVVQASNGLEGLEKFKELRPDIVVTDIRMPFKSGLDMSEEIRDIDSDVPIIVTTAFTDIEQFIRAIDIGVNKFVLKPVDASKLILAIKQISKNIENKRELKNKNRLLEEYKNAVDKSSIVSKTDKHGLITYVNDKFCKTSGYSREELVGKSHSIIRHPNTSKDFYAKMWKELLDKKIWKGIVQNRKKDGDSYYVDLNIIPILDENEQVVEYVGIVNDITSLVMKSKEVERMRIEQIKESIKRASDIRIKDIIENIPVPTMILDSNDKVLEINTKFEKILDIYKDSEILSKLKDKNLNLADIFISEDGYISRDPIVDWKDIISKLGQDEEYIAKLNISDEKNSFHVSVQKIEKIDEIDRYIVCLSQI